MQEHDIIKLQPGPILKIKLDMLHITLFRVGMFPVSANLKTI